MERNKAMLLHTSEYLEGLAEHLRAEADKAEAKTSHLETVKEPIGCSIGCWNILSSCIQIQPL